MNDYDLVLGGELESLYHVQDTWENYDRMAARLDERLAAWRSQTDSRADLAMNVDLVQAGPTN